MIHNTDVSPLNDTGLLRKSYAVDVPAAKILKSDVTKDCKKHVHLKKANELRSLRECARKKFIFKTPWGSSRQCVTIINTAQLTLVSLTFCACRNEQSPPAWRFRQFVSHAKVRARPEQKKPICACAREFLALLLRACSFARGAVVSIAEEAGGWRDRLRVLPPRAIRFWLNIRRSGPAKSSARDLSLEKFGTSRQIYSRVSGEIPGQVRRSQNTYITGNHIQI